MTVTNQSARTGRVVRAGEGQRIQAFGSEIRFMLTGEDTDDTLAVGVATVPVGHGPPPHTHHEEDELFLIIEGEYRVCLDGEWTSVGPGGVVYLPRGCAHSFQVVGEKPGRHWALTTSGSFARFFEKSAEVFAVPGPPDFGRLSTLAAEYGYSFEKRGAPTVAS
jgi:quercetin dioxygenase-like cupin family protein